MSLIEQKWWGNINNPKIIILGKNPSFRSKKNPDKKGRSDELDNENYETELYNNLNITHKLTRQEKGIETYLFDSLKDSYVGYWWNRALHKLIGGNSDLKNQIGIFNLYGFYSENLEYLPNEDSYIAKDETIKQNIVDLINDKTVTIYIMWKKSIKWWEQVLGVKFDCLDIIDRVKIVNGGKCHCNIYLSAAVNYSSIINKN